MRSPPLEPAQMPLAADACARAPSFCWQELERFGGYGVTELPRALKTLYRGPEASDGRSW